MKRRLLSVAIIIGLTSCNNTVKNKQVTEVLATAKTDHMKKILFVLTSYDELGNTGEKQDFGLKNLQPHIIF